MNEPYALVGDLPSGPQGGLPMDGYHRLNIGAAGRPAPTMSDLMSILGRHKLQFAAVFVLVMAIASGIIFTLQPSYRSDAMIVLDTREARINTIPNMMDAPQQPTDLNLVRSEVQILESTDIARHVVADLKLDQNPNFMPHPSAIHGLITQLREKIGLDAPVRVETAEDRMETAVRTYMKDLNVFNDGKSFVITLGFTDGDPVLAQQILAKHLDVYLANQKAAKERVLSKADNWLQTELTRLAAKVSASEKKLQAFQDANHLIRSGGVNGDTINGRQLADVTAQLAVARGDLLRKEARLATLKNGAGSDGDVLASQLVQHLREQEATLSAQVAQMSSRYGANYPGVSNARAALADTRARIGAEIGRMATAASSDVAAARSNTDRLQAEVNTLEGRAGADNVATLEVSQLQSETTADRQLYSDLLARSKQVQIQREIQQPDARVVAPATTPVQPVFPRPGLLMAVAVAAAAIIASGLVLLLDRSRTTSQTLGELEMMCGVAGLGMVPRIKHSARRLRSANDAQVLPRSYLGASLQSLRNSIAYRTAGQNPKVFLFTSALEGEGKSTLSMYFSRSMAVTGRKVLLIDADLRHPAVGSTLKMSPAVGIVGVLEGKRSLKDSVIRAPRLGLDVLAVERHAGNPHDLLEERMQALLDEARDQYDIIVIDTPPVAAVDDGLVIAGMADATVLVVRWARTPHEVVAGVVRRLHMAGAKLSGAVLNAADMSRYRASYGDLEAYRPKAQAYFLK